MSSTISFFVSFLIDDSDDKLSSIQQSHQINRSLICCRFGILEVDHFFINLDITSSSKVFSVFNYIFLSIILIN